MNSWDHMKVFMTRQLVGVWTVDCWEKMGKPRSVNLVELGPGKGYSSSSGAFAFVCTCTCTCTLELRCLCRMLHVVFTCANMHAP